MNTQNNTSDTESALATFGGGCFWCTEAIFQHLKGVLSVTSGYSGGETGRPSYREVCSGETGHAEVIEIEFDPTIISYELLLRVHMGTHDPTTLNCQGADHGTQYRSVILFRTDEEQRIAEDVIEEYSEMLMSDVVTEVKAFDVFYPAEEDHQNYYADNQNGRYCQAVIAPKLQKFRQTYQHLLNTEEA